MTVALVPRQVALLLSLGTLQAVASPSSSIEETHLKERALSVAEPLSSASADERGLQQDLCYFSLLNVFENVLMNNWDRCINTKAQEKNMNVAGARAEMNVECWCEENLQPTLELYGCCDSVYANFCQAICPPLLDNCTTAAAQTCISNCPAVCYENDYAPEFCDTTCQGCQPYVLCITNHSRVNTEVGHVAHPQVCDDNAFYESQEWKDWFDCYSKFPKRTHWARHNAENYCYCNSSLKAAATRFSCCNADWGQTICDEDCSNATQNVDCTTTEAQDCLNTCKQTCSKLYKTQMTTACRNQCMDASSTCEKYRVCEPAGPFEFDYVCDDGSSPNVRGCCTGRYGNPTCPKLCQSATGHYPALDAVNIRFTSKNLECSCEGCPSSTQATKDKYKTTLDENLFETGTLEIARIAREAGLVGPNTKMQTLLKERDDRIKAEFDAHQGLPDDTWQDKMDAIKAEYTPLFQAEAARYALYGDPSPTPSTATSSEDSNSTVIIIVASAGGVVMLVLMGLIIKLLMRAKRGGMPGQRPRDGDTNVVMGRPVAPGTQAEVTEGAPVATDEKGGDDNTKV